VKTLDATALFDTFTATAFRLETRQVYVVEDEAAALRASLEGQPLPERSVRTDPWLTRVARTTLNEGKRWSRIHVVDEPLSPYMRYELARYVENQAAGETIRIAPRRSDPRLAELDEDFWLFDSDTTHPQAIAMRYAPEGRYLGRELVTDPDQLQGYQRIYDMAWQLAVPLNAYAPITARG
jgi:hypothetical protein